MGLLDWLFSKPSEEPERPRPGYAAHLRTAAGIGTSQIRCHRDTWAYFVEEFEKTTSHRDSHIFRPAAEKDILHEANDMIMVSISGVSLAALLDRCFDIQFRSWTPSWNYTMLDKAIAERVGKAITGALARVVPATEVDGNELVIVLDDRPVTQSTLRAE
ncbi:hypothetical protein [Streptomyces anulatus]|uniref:hypothetical protein n=1 Tax=Streptomyces anulatus TaxID=1892 RepID=UPI0013DA4104|nr:hypothetical protein [Streptomyces anulatus]